MRMAGGIARLLRAGELGPRPRQQTATVMRWSRNCLTPPGRHCRTAYPSGSGRCGHSPLGSPQAAGGRRGRSVPANGAVSERSLRSRVDCPSRVPVRLSAPSCQLAPAIRGAHAARPSPHCRCAAQVRDPVPGIHLSRTRPEFPYHGVSWANASGREGDRDASGLPVRPELIAAPVTRLLGYRPMHGIRFLAIRSWQRAGVPPRECGLPAGFTLRDNIGGDPWTRLGEGIDQSG